jgi:membrane dipeptidase
MKRTYLRTVTFLGIVTFFCVSAVSAEDPALERARGLLARHPVIDGHNDLAWTLRKKTGGLGDVEAYDLRKPTSGQTDLERLRAGGVGGQLWSVFVPASEGCGHARFQLEQIDLARRILDRYPELERVTTAEEAERTMQEGRIASFLAMEGGHALENSLGALRAFFALGVRSMTLTHSRTLDWADSSRGPRLHGGLTRFGEEVVREMNRLGMLVDLSHVSPETMADALDVTEAPVIFSHSSVRALCDHPRNVPDDILKRLPDNGGLVMVTFVAKFISGDHAAARKARRDELEERARDITSPAERAALRREILARPLEVPVTVEQVADHVEHVRRTAGIDYVGLGGDYDGSDAFPQGLEDVSGYPRLFAELIRRGWTDEELAKLASGNFLRVLRQVEEVAARLQRERPASVATIQELDGS